MMIYYLDKEGALAMFMYVFSIVLIVMSNILYNICQKSTLEKEEAVYIVKIIYPYLLNKMA